VPPIGDLWRRGAAKAQEARRMIEKYFMMSKFARDVRRVVRGVEMALMVNYNKKRLNGM
jgi:hypothetical protein